MKTKFLLKATEEQKDFYELIGNEITFDCDIIDNSGRISHKKGEIAIINDIEYNPGHWSNICPDIYVQPKISSFKINGIESSCWLPDTFKEFKK